MITTTTLMRTSPCAKDRSRAQRLTTEPVAQKQRDHWIDVSVAGDNGRLHVREQPDIGSERDDGSGHGEIKNREPRAQRDVRNRMPFADQSGTNQQHDSAQKHLCARIDEHRFWDREDFR